MLTGFARWDAAVAASTRAVKRMHIIIKTSILWLLVDLVQNSTGLNWTGNIVPGQGEWDSIAEKFYNSLEPPAFRCFFRAFFFPFGDSIIARKQEFVFQFTMLSCRNRKKLFKPQKRRFGLFFYIFIIKWVAALSCMFLGNSAPNGRFYKFLLYSRLA